MRIQFSDSYVADSLEHEPGVLQRLKEHNQSGTPVYCLCQARPASPRLSVVRAVKNNTERYHLRCYPNTAHSHHPDCSFYSSHYAKHTHIPGIQAAEDGYVLRLDFGESRSASSEASIAKDVVEKSRPRNTSSEGSATLLGCLRHLADVAGLNVWKPSFSGRRPASIVFRRLHDAAEKTFLASESRPLTDCIVWPDPVRKIDLFRHQARSHAQPTGICLALGFLEAATLSRSGNGMNLTLAGFGPTFFAPLLPWNALLESFPLALRFKSDCTPIHKTLTLCSFRLTDTGLPLVLSLAPMLMSEHFVPCDSGYEVTMANGLVDAGREFIKPVRCIDKESPLPDFDLLDTERETVIEVWGLNSEEYRRRKMEKSKWYAQRQITVIPWDAANSSAFPNLKHTS